MSGNTFGTLFRVTTFGESHGVGIGAVIDGCPAGVPLTVEEIQVELDRRRPGQSAVTSPRRESDRVTILAGMFDGRTTGAPIALFIPNEDARPSDYAPLRDIIRPAHADFTYAAKYGVRDWRGSGRASARETAARVAAGAVARAVLARAGGVEIVGFVSAIEDIEANVESSGVTRAAVEANIVRCPDPQAAERMIARIAEVRAAGDSVGGVVTCVARGVPIGLGEPVFDKLHADLGKAMLSINAVKGFEIGSGFAGTRMRGSVHNDPFVATPTGPRPASNRAGGVLGGISTGEPIECRLAFKPVATIAREQSTTTTTGEPTTIAAAGRHDPCVVPRAVPIVEAMAALVLCDHLLRARAVGEFSAQGST